MTSIDAAHPSSIRWWHFALVAALTVAAFLPVCALTSPRRFEFTAWDDDANVAANRELFGDIEQFWARPYRNMYIPLSYTAWALLARVAGDEPGQLNPGVFHIANVMLHAAGAVMVLLILLRCGLRPWAAAAGAGVWAVHPLQLEPVVWITGFRDVLSGTLVLGALACAAEGEVKKQREKETIGVGVGWWIWGTVLFAAALLAKPSAMVGPVLAAIVLVGVMGRPWQRVMAWLAVWLMLAVATAVLAQRVQPATIVASVPGWARPLVAADAVGFYLKKIVWPVGMIIDHGRSPAWLLNQGPWAWSGIMAAVVAGGAWAMRRRWPGAWWGMAILLAALLPVLGLVRFDFQRHSTVADRYMYLAMLGVALLVGDLANRAILPGQGRSIVLAASLYIAVVGTLIGLTWRQMDQWHDSRSLFESAVRVNPTSLAGNNGLGVIHMQRAEWPAMRECYERALARDPDDSVTQSNFGAGLLASGRADEAAGYLRRALPGQPYPWVYNNLAIALAGSSHLDEALAVSREAVAKFPEVPDIHFAHGELLMLKGERAAAAEAYRRVLKLRPGWTMAEARLREAR